MWSTTVVLSVIFSYYRVFGGEIPDVTTVYELGLGKTSADEDLRIIEDSNSDDDWTLLDTRIISPVHETTCINGVTGRVHSRSNALGLGIIDEEGQYFDYNSSEIPNVTCDVNYFYDKSCTRWDFTSGMNWKWLDDLQAGKTISNWKAYQIEKQLYLKKQDIQKTTNFFFTQGSGSLKNENIYVVMQIENTNARRYTDCDNGTRYSHLQSYSFDALDRDGSSTKVYCQDGWATFTIKPQEYLTFDFGDERNKQFKLYTGKSQVKYLEVDWTDFESHYGRQAKINYFSITTDDADANAFTFLPKALELTDKGMVSPIFTPQSNNLCLAIFLHSSMTSLLPEIDIYVSGLLPNDEDLLHTISHVKNGWNSKIVNVLLENLNPIKLSIRKSGMAKINIARVASCNPDGEEVIELPSPITVCPQDRRIRPWGTGKSSLHLYTTSTNLLDAVERITNTTNYCLNGGVLTSAGCACTPGFSGSSCEIGCGRNRFGQDCEGLCSFHSEECQGLLLCTKYTGCRCAPGYRGHYCTQACIPGWYGNDCSERCGHCAGNSTCDIYTGDCMSCDDGYLAPHCKRASVYYGSKPEVTTPSYGTIVVSFDPTNYVTQHEPPQLYQIQLREKGDQWKVYTSKSLQKSNDESENEKKVSEKIAGLKSGVLYQVRVLFIDTYFMKYDGDLVQIAEVLTKCDIPSSYDYKVTTFYNTSAVSFSWRYVTEDQIWCPLETFEVAWREGWKKQKILTTDDNFSLSRLVPGLPIKFKVRAKTSRGFAPYSKIMITSAQQNELPPVRNLRVASSQSTSVEVSWEPPRGSRDSQLRYTISFKCVDRPACSPGCQNVSEGQLTQEGTGISLSPLLPFTKYLVTVSAEGGSESSIYVGTTKVVPTEVPSLSAQRPVRANTSLTVFWDQVPVCTGYQLGYNYQLTKASDPLRILESGFTKETNASFHNLTASTDYVIRVFVVTVAGWNPLSYLTMNINTSATVPEAVRNLTVYKRGRGMLGLRWAEPRANYGQLKSFTVTHSLGQEVISHTVEPSHCVVWPDLYCHTIEGLRSNRRYNSTVSARNVEVSEDGEPATVTAITKESSPTAPVNLKVVNSTSTSIVLQWGHPELVNGILRSFFVSIEETEKYDQESCCQVYPLVETSVKEEYQKYDAEVSGLHPASTYFVSVSAKTVGLGPSQSLVAYTRPPHLPLTVLPRAPEVSWLPQDKLPEVNNSDIYTSLVKAHLLLAIINETQPDLKTPVSGITDPKLDSLLKQKIGKAFYFIAEYDQDDDVELSGPLEDGGSTWGRPPASLSPEVGDQLVAAQILEYSGVYNVDLRYSQPLTMV